MPSKKLINQKLTILRNWLYPGLVWDTAPPDRVSEELGAVIDLEHWVEVPRFQAHCTSPDPGIGRLPVVAFENYVRNPRGTPLPLPPAVGLIGTAVNTRFNVTDIWARLAFIATSAAAVYSRRTNAAGGASAFTDPANLDYYTTEYLIASDADPFLGIYSGDVADPNPGNVSLNQAGDAYTWVPLPDLSPGNGYVFVGQTANVVMHVDLMWTERRPPGQPNVGNG